MDLGYLCQLCMEISCYATPIASPVIKASRFPLQWTLNYHLASLSSTLPSAPFLFHSPIFFPLGDAVSSAMYIKIVFSPQWACSTEMPWAHNLLSFQNSNWDHGLYLVLQCWGLNPGHFAWLASVPLLNHNPWPQITDFNPVLSFTKDLLSYLKTSVHYFPMTRKQDFADSIFFSANV